MQVLGRALVPGVTFMELAARCMDMLLSDTTGIPSSSGGGQLQPALSALTIPAPCFLPALGSAAAAGAVLRCQISTAGVVEVYSGASSGRQTHMHAAAAVWRASPAASGLLAARAATALAPLISAAAVAAVTITGALAAVAEVSAVSPAASSAHATAEAGQLDAVLQLCAAAKGHAEQRLASVLHVPAAADLYSSQTYSNLSAAAGLMAAAAIRPGLSQRLLVADCRLALPDGAAASTLQGLQARALAALPAAPAAAATAAAAAAPEEAAMQQAQDMLYDLELVAATVAATQAEAGQLQAAAPSHATLLSVRRTSAALAATAHAMAAAQQLMHGGRMTGRSAALTASGLLAASDPGRSQPAPVSFGRLLTAAVIARRAVPQQRSRDQALRDGVSPACCVIVHMSLALLTPDRPCRLRRGWPVC